MTTRQLFKLPVAMLCCAFAVSLTSCEEDGENITKLSFNPSSPTVEVGGTTKVIVSGGKSPYIVTTADSSIGTATTDADTIFVTGVKAGVVVMTAADGYKHIGTLVVTVE